MSKRLLTNDEIDYILDGIKPCQNLPKEVFDCCMNACKYRLKLQAKEIYVYPQNISILREIVDREYERSKIDPGTMIGMTMSLNLGSLYTQSVLNSFHSAGQSRLSSSNLSRLDELTQLSKNPKVKKSLVYFEESYRQGTDYDIIKKIKRKCARDIEYKVIEDFCLSTEIFYEKEIDEDWYDSFFVLSGSKIGKLVNGKYVMEYSWMMRLRLDRKKIYEANITLDEIASIIDKEGIDMYCVYSTEELAIIDVYVDTSEISVPISNLLPEEKKDKEVKKGKKKKRTMLSKEFSKIKLLFEDEEEELTEEEQDIPTTVKAKSFINEDNHAFIFFLRIVEPTLLNIKVCGMEGIDKCYIEKYRGEYVAITSGSNFRELIICEGIDWRRCKTTYVWEIYETLGIEAFKQYIVDEINDSFNSNSYVHRSYSQLCADTMTYTGKITSVNRHGIDRNNVGPLAKASFEEPLKNITKAALDNETDLLDGVSACVIMGKHIKGGTNSFDIRFQMDTLK